MASTWHIQSSSIYIKQPPLHPFVFSFHIRSIIITLTPNVINIKTIRVDGFNQYIEKPFTGCVIHHQETKKVLNFYVSIKNINTPNQQTHLFLVTNIWG